MTRYRLTLEPLPDHPSPPAVRLRRALKALRRMYGLRVVDSREVRRDEEIKQGVRGVDPA